MPTSPTTLTRRNTDDVPLHRWGQLVAAENVDAQAPYRDYYLPAHLVDPGINVVRGNRGGPYGPAVLGNEASGNQQLYEKALNLRDIPMGLSRPDDSHWEQHQQSARLREDMRRFITSVLNLSEFHAPEPDSELRTALRALRKASEHTVGELSGYQGWPISPTTPITYRPLVRWYDRERTSRSIQWEEMLREEMLRLFREQISHVSATLERPRLSVSPDLYDALHDLNRLPNEVLEEDGEVH